jgi:serine protease inhibitor
MPKFEFDSSFSLKKVLTEMGMPVAFSANADFSSMTGNEDLYIYLFSRWELVMKLKTLEITN